MKLLTESQTLAKDATSRHVLLHLQFTKVLVAGKDQHVHQVHDTIDEGDTDLQGQALGGLNHVGLVLEKATMK